MISDDVLALNPILHGHKVVQVGHGYKSNLEKRFVDEVIIPSCPNCWYYEPMSFGLLSGRYTPDFMMVWFESDSMTIKFYEVKGYTKSIRADRKAFREAAKTHTWATWSWCTWNKNEGWKFEEWRG